VKDLAHTKPAQLLIARVKTLLQREIWRDTMNQALLALCKGDFVTTASTTGDCYHVYTAIYGRWNNHQ
jgi:hypothetical protein